jgi:hypothetical protein
MRHLFIFLLLFLASATYANEDGLPSAFSKVPANQLEGTRLKLAEGKFSVAAPSTAWKWYAIASTRPTYCCLEPKSRTGFQIMLDDKIGNLDDGVVRDIVNGGEKGARKNNFKILDEQIKASDVPIAGKSYRCSFVCTMKDGQKLYWVQYITLIEKNIVIVQYSDMTPETEAFTTFVKSLQLAK